MKIICTVLALLVLLLGLPTVAGAAVAFRAAGTVTAPAITPLNSNDMIVFVGTAGDTSTIIPTFSAQSGTNPTFVEVIDKGVVGDSMNVAEFLAYGIKTDMTSTGQRKDGMGA